MSKIQEKKLKFEESLKTQTPIYIMDSFYFIDKNALRYAPDITLPLFRIVVNALVWKRDNEKVDLTIKTLKDSFSLNTLIILEETTEIPESIRGTLRKYLISLNGWDSNNIFSNTSNKSVVKHHEDNVKLINDILDELK